MNNNDKKAQIIAAIVFFVLSPIAFILTGLMYTALNIEPTTILVVLQAILAAAFGLLFASISVIIVRKSHKS